MTGQRERDRVDPGLWLRGDMRAALAARDIAGVFRILQRVGVSQRRIAALTGQSQSEISEILAGRHVVSYDVLARIADGLGVPRGQLGLAYDEVTAQLIGEAEPAGDEEDARRLLGRLTELTVGAATIDARTLLVPLVPSLAPALDHVGRSDIVRLEEITRRLRVMDHEHGGGSCRDAVVAQLGWAHQLLRADARGDATRDLHLAVADLHMLAGWTSFDVGVIGAARRHFARALEHARFVEEASLMAKALYCFGRLHLHHGWATQAIRTLHVGQVIAQQSGYGRAVAMTQANLAWAYALTGDTRRTLDAIGRARDEFARSEHLEAPRWLMFFDSAELQALRGTALAALPQPSPAHRAEAIERFSLSTAMRELPQARPRAFELTALAWLLIDDGAVEQGIRIGNEAVDVAVQLRSRRVVDRFAPLRTRLAKRLTDADAHDLAERIKRLSPIDQAPLPTPPNSADLTQPT